MTDAIGERWDDEYRRGRYDAEPPLPFVRTIVQALQATPGTQRDVGLYVGCGNGRNYWPLVEAGANLEGLDVSEEAIRRLTARHPDRGACLRIGDFRCYERAAPLGYLVAIQVFQHGGSEDVRRYFARVATVLRPGGLFFLRVNASTTEVYHPHTLVERNEHGGFTVRYEAGPKTGLLVHFYAWNELLALTTEHFDLVWGPREDVVRRAPPQRGTWSQWEAIWRRRDA